MKLTATEFRKDLFSVLERVLQGETAEIIYKGSAVRVAPGGSSSKLARAKCQNTLLCDPDAIIHSDKKLLAKMEAGWRKGWSKM
jgi:antitoxin (DNA-binding transcriptional repressor) of toxin-antitoxin stability system